MGCGGGGGGLTVAQRGWLAAAAAAAAAEGSGFGWDCETVYSCGHWGEPLCQVGASSGSLWSGSLWSGLDMRGDCCALFSFFLTFLDVDSGVEALGLGASADSPVSTFVSLSKTNAQPTIALFDAAAIRAAAQLATGTRATEQRRVGDADAELAAAVGAAHARRGHDVAARGQQAAKADLLPARLAAGLDVGARVDAGPPRHGPLLGHGQQPLLGGHDIGARPLVGVVRCGRRERGGVGAA